MINKGEIIRQEVYLAGVTVTSLAESMGVQRKTVYNYFKKANLSHEIITQIGSIIKVDFTNKINGYGERNSSGVVNEDRAAYSVDYSLVKRLVESQGREIDKLLQTVETLARQVVNHTDRIGVLEKSE